jgi:hypothetical protein
MTLNKIIIFIISALSLYSCAGIEGCIDPVARNFDPEADKNCCCQYYQLRLDMVHSIDSFNTPFVLFNFYSDANADAYQIKSTSILISDVALLKADGTASYVNDSILLSSSSGSSWQRNDFSNIRPGVFVNNIGSFTDFGNYVKLRFLVGLQDALQQTDGSNLSTAHPLSTASEFNSANGFLTGRWEIINNLNEPMLYFLSDTVWVELDYPVSCIDGADTNIPLGLNYNALMQGIAFASDDSTTVVQKIKNNIRNAFYIR